ncbi:hypothetical protein RJI07_06260 [Mycoplasmatota bacterium WC30]
MRKSLKSILMVMVLTISVVLLTNTVKADMGPKPTSDIKIIGMDEPYYFDLLVEFDKGEVTVLSEADIEEQLRYYYTDTHPDILNGYIDEDNYASYTLYYGNAPHYISVSDDDSNEFHIGYFRAPDVFKIALVTESGELLVSDIIHKQNFNAYFEVNIMDASVLESPLEVPDFVGTYTGNLYITDVDEILGYETIALQTIINVTLTLIIELGVLFLFGYREKKSYKTALILNLITQTILTIFILFAFKSWSIFGAVGVFLIGELIVFTIEIVTYRKLLKENTKTKATIYALVANAGSLVLGYIFTVIVGTMLF